MLDEEGLANPSTACFFFSLSDFNILTLSATLVPRASRLIAPLIALSKDAHNKSFTSHLERELPQHFALAAVQVRIVVFLSEEACKVVGVVKRRERCWCIARPPEGRLFGPRLRQGNVAQELFVPLHVNGVPVLAYEGMWSCCASGRCWRVLVCKQFGVDRRVWSFLGPHVFSNRNIFLAHLRVRCSKQPRIGGAKHLCMGGRRLCGEDRHPFVLRPFPCP